MALVIKFVIGCGVTSVAMEHMRNFSLA